MNLGRENEKVEFKKSTSERGKAVESIAAMLNKGGEGTVYFGVRDDGEVVGQQIGSNTLRELANDIGQALTPRIYPDVNEEETPEGIKYISVRFSGSETPYSVDGRFFIRVADQDRLADAVTLRKLLASASFDALREKPAYSQDLTFNILFAYLSGMKKNPKNNESYYRNSGLLTLDGKFNYQAELLSDQSRASLKVSQFFGRDKDVQSFRNDFGGKPLFLGMREAESHINSICERRVILRDNGLERREIPLFDMDAFREAWINAVVHNSWFELGEPAIYIFSDRLEVVSFGGLPIRLGMDDFFKGKSMPVNPSLFRIFANLNIVEENGHGIKKIVAAYGREAIAVSANFVTVTIPFAFLPSFAASLLQEALENDSQKAVVRAIMESPSSSFKTISAKTGLTISAVRTVCENLQKAGILKRNGGRKGGRWEININR